MTLNKIIHNVPGVNIEDIPTKIANNLLNSLNNNGGNCIAVDAESKFGQWLGSKGVVFDNDWTWVVIWR